MAEKKSLIEGVSSTATSPVFECGQCGFKTKDLQKHQDHLIEHPHNVYSGNYPCKLCKKIVTIVPDYIDVPAPGSELPNNNQKLVHEKFKMVKKRPVQAQIAGGLGVCDDCREELRKQLA